MIKKLIAFLKKEREKEWKHQLLSYEDTKDFNIRLFRRINFDFSNKKILDVGCCWGTSAVFLAQNAKEVVGIDVVFKETWTKFQRKYPNLKFKVADACHLPFAKASFDVVFLKDVLHHIFGYPKALEEFRRITREGGAISLVEPNKYNTIFYLHFTWLRHHYHFSGSYFKSLISATFTKVKFKHLEIHNYPVNNRIFRLIFGFLRLVFEKLPLLNRLFSYIVAIVQI